MTFALAGRMVCVAGLGVSGFAAARALAERDARVVVVEAGQDQTRRDRAARLQALGVVVRFGANDTLPDGTELLVTSPGWRPDAPLLAAARAAGIEVLGEVELAWRLRPERAAAWLAVTGTNGKTTTVRMLEGILNAAGHATLAVGNVGTPIVDAVFQPYDALAVELSSFQLHWSSTLRPYAAVVLNVAADHLDWHGSLEEYAAVKGRVYRGAEHVIHNADDAWSAALAEPYGGGVAFTLDIPAEGQLGVVDDILVDRAFPARSRRGGLAAGEKLAELRDVRPSAPHNVANALAAAALARAYGVPPDAVRAGLRSYVSEPHRMQHVGTVLSADWIDDSKATNPHAAAASLSAYRSVVWIAGGQLKGAPIDDVVASAAQRLRGVVLLGQDRTAIRDALARHAPDVPVVEVVDTDTGAMDRVVAEAARLARPGDTVLLAPAGASFDMYASYAARGEAFTAAVRRLAAKGERQ